MKKLFRFLLRILIMFLIIFILLFGIKQVLKIKHRDKLKENTNNNWDWNRENQNYFYLFNEKYSRENDEKNNLLIRMKNSSVPEKKDGEKRILVVGDSFIYGVGSTNVNYLWWKQLNLRIKEAGYSNVNVYAAGYYGLNTKEELELVLNNGELIKNIDPDLIIIGYVPNDPEEHNEDGSLTVKADWELIPEENKIYKENPELYYELVDRLHALSVDEYDKIIEIGERLGAHRWDARLLYLVQDERLEKYREVLKNVDSRIKELNIPYFYAVTNNFESYFADKSLNIVFNEMKKISVHYFSPEHNYEKLLKDMKIKDYHLLNVNPVDTHPGIVWTYNYSRLLFEELKDKYSFIFENPVIENVNKLKLNINDTMPFLDVVRIDDNIFEFEYPMKEEKKENNSNFLYYPIEKNYIKLNLEYPKDIKKIKITGDNLEAAEVYVNTIDEKYGFDYNEAFKKLTPCRYILNNTYLVNKKITSVNIHAVFKSEEDRTLKIEFIE